LVALEKKRAPTDLAALGRLFLPPAGPTALEML
jgi:hypothetical protein